MSSLYIVINEMWNFLIFPFMAILLAIALTFFLVYYWKVIPPVAKTFIRAKRRNRVPVYVVHDSGHSQIELFTARKGALALTERNRFKILPRFSAKRDLRALPVSESVDEAPMELPPGVNLEDLPEDVRQNYINSLKSGEQSTSTALKQVGFDVPKLTLLREIYDKFHLDYSTWTSRRSMLRGLGQTMFVAYSGVACLLNPEALALFLSAEMKVEIDGEMKFNPLNVETTNTIKMVPQPLLTLDPRVISTIISDQFNESAIAEIQLESKLMAYEEQGFGKYMPLLAIMVIGIIAFVGIMFFMGG